MNPEEKPLLVPLLHYGRDPRRRSHTVAVELPDAAFLHEADPGDARAYLDGVLASVREAFLKAWEEQHRTV